MAFLRNRTVNLLNLHYGIHALAMSGGGAFLGVFLLKAGISLPATLGAIALIFMARFIIRPIVLVVAPSWGMRRLVIVGTLLSAVQYLLIAEVTEVGPMLFAFLLASAAGETVYWSSYHAYFAALGDDEHRGHQLGLREAVVAVVGIVSPLLTGFLLITFGPMAAFGASAVVTIISVVPLFWTPDVPVAPHVTGAFKAAIPGIKLFVADGICGAGYHIAWQLALFLSLGENFLAYGGALAVAALVGAVIGLLLGRQIDAGHGGRAVWLACGVFAAVVLLRAFAVGDAALALIANALGALVVALYIPTMMTAVYNQAKRSPCVLRFHVATEGGWDAGAAGGLTAAALLVWAGGPVSAVILLALIGVVALFVMLRRYYAANPTAVIEVPAEPALHPGGI